MEKVGIFVAILVGIVVTTTSANHAITAPSFRSALRLFNNPIESRVGLSKATTPNRKNMHFVTEEEGIFARTKRQTTCALTNEVRDQRLAEVQCDADYMNALQELEGIECSFVATIRQFAFFITQRSFPECGTDRNGVLCGVALALTAQIDPDDVARDIIKECFENVENCTDECKTLLEAFVRFDCCVHSLSVTSSEQLIRALTSQLWDDCGVILPAPCDNAPPELPPIDLNISCSYECTINQAQALFCKYQAQEAISIYLECGDDESALRIQQPCGFNDRGEFCFPVGRSSFPINILGFYASVIRDDLNDEYFLELYSKCISFVSTGKCPSECRDALANAKETYGCCFNNANGTALGLSSSEADPVDSIRSFVTSYDLWSGCVIETPGFCNFPSDDSVFDEFLRCSPDTCDPQSTPGTFPPGVLAAIALPVILLMIAVAAMVYCCYCKR